MNKKYLKVYFIVSILQATFTIFWTHLFSEKFPKPISSCIATIVSAQIFFWFGYYAPRLSFIYAEKKGKLFEQMSSIQWIIFGWFIIFGAGTIFQLIQPITIAEPERVMFLSIPLAMSIGAFSTWKMIKKNLKKMQVDKKNRSQFYSELKNTFPEIAQMRFWNDNDYVDEPLSSSGIMTEIGEIVIVWAEHSEVEKIQSLMIFFELSYELYNDETTCDIYTDFLPTIISMKNSELRETIKKQLLTETMKHYNQLIDLGFYIEN